MIIVFFILTDFLIGHMLDLNCSFNKFAKKIKYAFDNNSGTNGDIIM